MTESILIRVYDDDDDPIHPEIVFSDFIANPSAYHAELVDDEITKLTDRLAELEKSLAFERATKRAVDEEVVNIVSAWNLLSETARDMLYNEELEQEKARALLPAAEKEAEHGRG